MRAEFVNDNDNDEYVFLHNVGTVQNTYAKLSHRDYKQA